MRVETLGATVERQISSRFRASSFWVGAVVPVLLIGALLYQAGKTTSNPPMTMFLAILSALWVGGSGCVREIVDERKLVQREPHLSLLAYALAKILHASLLAAGQSLILTLAVLFSGVIGLPLFTLWFILFLTTVAGSLMALLLSALCDEAATALAWFPLVLVPQVVFGGFLFPYGAIRPFGVNRETNPPIVEDMPDWGIRSAVESGPLYAIGALAVSRWALEAYAAHVFEQDLSDQEAVREATQVATFVPLSLSDEPIVPALRAYTDTVLMDPAAPAPGIDVGSGRYSMLLAGFVAVEAVLLVLILPVRDPRRN